MNKIKTKHNNVKNAPRRVGNTLFTIAIGGIGVEPVYD